jgi:hypothetical protein
VPPAASSRYVKTVSTPRSTARTCSPAGSTTTWWAFEARPPEDCRRVSVAGPTVPSAAIRWVTTAPPPYSEVNRNCPFGWTATWAGPAPVGRVLSTAGAPVPSMLRALTEPLGDSSLIA